MRLPCDHRLPVCAWLSDADSIMVASAGALKWVCSFANAEAIETLRTVDTLVLDKTGTLTPGTTGAHASDRTREFSQEVLLACAAGLERSTASILWARAIVDGALARGVTPVEVAHFRLR